MSVQSQIENKLTERFSPASLEVLNESHTHNVPPGSESHFKVIIVSDAFAEQTLIQRHRAVNSSLSEELQIIHALSIHAFTPQEWLAKGNKAPTSPPCQGGGKS